MVVRLRITLREWRRTEADAVNPQVLTYGRMSFNLLAG